MGGAAPLYGASASGSSSGRDADLYFNCGGFTPAAEVTHGFSGASPSDLSSSPLFSKSSRSSLSPSLSSEESCSVVELPLVELPARDSENKFIKRPFYSL